MGMGKFLKSSRPSKPLHAPVSAFCTGYQPIWALDDKVGKTDLMHRRAMHDLLAMLRGVDKELKVLRDAKAEQEAAEVDLALALKHQQCAKVELARLQRNLETAGHALGRAVEQLVGGLLQDSTSQQGIVLPTGGYMARQTEDCVQSVLQMLRTAPVTNELAAAKTANLHQALELAVLKC